MGMATYTCCCAWLLAVAACSAELVCSDWLQQSMTLRSQGQLLLSTFMEFWLSDGDCPLPGTGDRSAPDTPKKPSDGWAGLQ